MPDVTPETQGHVGTDLDGLFARNTVDCWVVNNAHVFNAPGLPKTRYVLILEADLAATSGPDITRIGALVSFRSTCSPTMSRNGMNMKVKSQNSKGMSLPDEDKEK